MTNTVSSTYTEEPGLKQKNGEKQNAFKKQNKNKQIKAGWKGFLSPDAEIQGAAGFFL